MKKSECKSICIACLICLIALISNKADALEIPKTGSTIESFVPKGYSIREKKEADFNGDGKTDIVMVIEMSKKDNESLFGDEPRPLIILFKQADGTYRLSAKSEDLVLCTGCGGVAGDPFMGIEIKKNSFSIHHHGGSSTRWSNKHQFRFQDNDWYLIGKTKAILGGVSDIGCPELSLNKSEGCFSHETDTNLLTGHQVEKWEIRNMENEKSRIKTSQRKIAIKPLQRLSEVSVEE